MSSIDTENYGINGLGRDYTRDVAIAALLLELYNFINDYTRTDTGTYSPPPPLLIRVRKRLTSIVIRGADDDTFFVEILHISRHCLDMVG